MENPPPGSSSSATGRRRRRIKKKIEPSLSNTESFPLDDLIIDILSRLPAKYVLVCRCVCRKWKDLISSKEFIDLNTRRSLPMILKDYHGHLSLLDRCWEFSRTKAQIHKVYKQYGTCHKFSHNGLIVAETSHYNMHKACYFESFDIFNPIYSNHTVNIIVQSKQPCIAYGVFFHPVLKEYCTLWRMVLSFQPLKVQYRILNLESKPQWRDINNPSIPNARFRGIRPVLIDMFLYWMVNPDYFPSSCDILEYDIRNENFRLIPCPVSITVQHKESLDNVNLVDLDGVVSLVQIIPSKELVEIQIWTLKYQEGLSWTCTQYIVSSDVYQGNELPKAVAFWNGELIIESDGRLYVCNLKLGTFRKFGQKYVHRYVTFLSHVTSIVSLRNCKSKICMTEEDEKIQIESSSCSDEIQAL